MTAQVMLSSKFSVQACKMDQSSFLSICPVVPVEFFFFSSWQTRALLSETYAPHLWRSVGAQDLHPRFEIAPLVSHPILCGDEQGWLYCMRLFQVTWGLYRNQWNKALGCTTIGIPEAKNTFLLYLCSYPCLSPFLFNKQSPQSTLFPLSLLL